MQPLGSPGWKGTACVERSVEEPGRPVGTRERPQHLGGIHNRKRGSARESERPIVVKKRGNACGAKGPYWKCASNERKGEPLECGKLHYGRDGTDDSAA